MFSLEEVLRTKTNLTLVGTVLVVSNLVANNLTGVKLFDETWVNMAFATLLGFTVNGLVTNKLYTNMVPSLDNKNTGLLTSVQDIVTWSTVFLSQKLVVSYLEGKTPVFDTKWFMSCGLVIAGYCLYNLFVNDMMPNVGNMQALVNDLVKVTMGALLSNYIVDGSVTQTHLMALGGTLAGFTAFHLGTKSLLGKL